MTETPAVVNYFNYFTEIEEHFQRRRGGALLLSALDWALIETWKDAQFPLQAFLRGIDTVFDRRDRRKGRHRKVNGLAFCTQEVMLAAEQMKEASVGAAANSTAQPSLGFSPAEVAGFMTHSAAALQLARLPEPACSVTNEAIAALHGMTREIRARESVVLEDVERTLTALEEKLLAALLTFTPHSELAAIQAEVDREIAPYRRKMQSAQIQQLHRQYLQKKLFDKAGVPRLSLFYM